MKEDTKEKSGLTSKGILAIIAIVVAVIAAVIITLVMSGAFGAKEARLYDGLNELKPGSYICVNNGEDYVSGYIVNDETDDETEVGFWYGNKTSVVVKPGQKVEIYGRGDEIDIVCTKN